MRDTSASAVLLLGLSLVAHPLVAESSTSLGERLLDLEAELRSDLFVQKSVSIETLEFARHLERRAQSMDDPDAYRRARELAVAAEWNNQPPPSKDHLDGSGAIVGLVRDASTGRAIEDAEVEVWTTTGGYRGSTSSGAAGEYVLPDLEAGSYVVTASAFPRYLLQMFDGEPCSASSCDPTAGMPVAVVEGSTTGGIDFDLEAGPLIGGTITDAATGEPIGGVAVSAEDAFGNRVGGGDSDALGRYVFPIRGAGDHFLVARSTAYRSEIYDDLPCPDAYCYDVSSGTPVVVADGEDSFGRNFDLDRLGGISGTVTSASTGEPLVSTRVEVTNLDSGRTRYAYTDSLGRYSIGGLPAGTHSVGVDPYSDYLAELWDGIFCPSNELYSCDPSSGTPVTVVLDQITSGIDFTIEAGGSISGRLTDFRTGEPIYDGYVIVHRPDGFDDSASTDMEGRYRVRGLAGGTYYASAHADDHRAELFDDLACVSDHGESCDDPTAGQPIPVVAGEEVEGVDFALNRHGRIIGTVRDRSTGRGIEDARVRAWDADGHFVASADRTGADGRFELRPPSDRGPLFLTAQANLYEGQLHAGIACDDCDPTGGTAVMPGVDEVLSIDFSLGFTGIGSCDYSQYSMCLTDYRFHVEVEWRDPGNVEGRARSLFSSDDSGVFWFFTENNWEMLVKVLNGCGINNRFWVFAAATTDVEYTLSVTDTMTGETKTYFNPLGRASPAITDTEAFATCQ